MKNKILLILLVFCVHAKAQIIQFEDINFKEALLNTNCVVLYSSGLNSDADVNNDGEISIQEAFDIKQLFIQTVSIRKVAEINLFQNIQSILIYESSIDTIELMGLNSLNNFYLNNEINNPNRDVLKFARFENLPNLYRINCSYTLLEILIVRNCPTLQELLAYSNNINSLEISNTLDLLNIDLSNNNLVNFNIGFQPSLGSINLNQNNLTKIDVSNCTNLFSLWLSHNFNLDSINMKNGAIFDDILIDNCINLKYICCDNFNIPYISTQLLDNGIENCVLSSYCSFIPGGNYNTISGNIQYDIDNNGCDIIDVFAQNIKLEFNDNTYFGTCYTNENGVYNFYTDSLNITMQPIIANSYFTITPNSANVMFPDDSNHIAIQNFCIAPNGIHNDVEVNLFPISIARPGFDSKYKIVFSNNGTNPTNGNITFRFDDNLMDFVNASLSPTSINTDILNFYYSNLLPFEKREIIVTMHIHSPLEIQAVNAGDYLALETYIYPNSNDENINDNESNLRQIVQNSFDPNDKTCTEGDKIDITQLGNYLHYVIRFENTGNYQAENIVVVDSIDLTKFDISSLQTISASHNYFTRIKDNKIEFIFEHINLPFDDANNDGYIAFKIKTLPILPLGTILQNRANIYFDYNLPIFTNRTNTVITDNVGINEFGNTPQITILPNPSKELIILRSSQAFQQIEILDIQGKILFTESNKIDNNETKINITMLPKGIYLAKIYTIKGLVIQRFSKL